MLSVKNTLTTVKKRHVCPGNRVIMPLKTQDDMKGIAVGISQINNAAFPSLLVETASGTATKTNKDFVL